MISLKQLRTEDTALADTAVRDIKRATPDSGHAARFLSSDRNIFLVALVDDNPVGFALAYELQRADARANQIFFYEIEVVESFRRRGVARALINRLKQICRERRISKMFVLTERDNQAARELYRRTGAHEVRDGEVLYVFE